MTGELLLSLMWTLLFTALPVIITFHGIYRKCFSRVSDLTDTDELTEDSK